MRSREKEKSSLVFVYMVDDGGLREGGCKREGINKGRKRENLVSRARGEDLNENKLREETAVLVVLLHETLKKQQQHYILTSSNHYKWN